MTTATGTTGLEAITGTWAIDPSHSTVAFSARHAMVAKVRGGFTEFEGTLVLDGANTAASTISVTIQAASINTGTADRDAHLTSADFLDVENYPTLTFASTELRHVGGNDFVLVGDLTIHGVTKTVEIPAELLGVNGDPWGGTRIGVEAKTEISRKEYGLTWNVAIEGGGILVGDSIKIELDIEAVKQA